MGSVRQFIDTSSNVKNWYIYEPFGNIFAAETTETTDNAFTFTGQWYDEEIGQYYLRARMYDPQLYRFTARDPCQGDFKEPLTLHAYLYCLNDPANRIDPEGRMASLIGTGMVAGGRLLYDSTTLSLSRMLGNTLERLMAEHRLKTDLVTEAMRRGKGAEYALEKALKLANSQVRAYTETGSYRVFDFEDGGVFVEVKNRSVLRRSDQLEEMAELAKSYGNDFVIVVRENTSLTQPLLDWIFENNIVLQKILPMI